ncbi:MAG: hypothetical protein JSW20_01100 [Nitrospiraceae bacterium]|nr:MAG: hypothetical protein JSW20_01100 [Nitrospiraceae bacterium]
MSFWEKIQEDLKKNLQEGLEIFREGSSVVTDKLEKFTEEGKKKYKVFNLNMKVQEDFAKLGGEIYDLISKKSKNPLGNKKVKSIIAKINKMEDQISTLESKDAGETVKKSPKKATKKKTVRKKKTAEKKSAAKKQTKKST